MLDINAVLALLDGRSPRLDGRFAEQRCCLSAIVAAEIQYGLERRRVSEAVISLIEGLLEAIEILPWSEACARTYGRLRTELEQRSTPLAPMDLLIASHALCE